MAWVDLYDAFVAPLSGGVVAHVVRVDVAKEDESLHVVRKMAKEGLEERHRLHGTFLLVVSRRRVIFGSIWTWGECVIDRKF